ncbi:MAG: Ig-like domain-containing protein, partial [Planctomycetota bacterium]|nr:Ig-like domain-containing protein [Planctomycetota bacterium]
EFIAEGITELFDVLRDTTPPQLVSYAPSEGWETISVYTDLRWEFSEPLDPKTVNSETVRVWYYDAESGVWIRIEGELRLEDDGRTIVFVPSEPLPLGATVKWELSGLSDLLGNIITEVIIGQFISNTDVIAWVDPNPPHKGTENAKYDPSNKRNQKNWVVSPQMNELKLNAHLKPQLKGDEEATCKWENEKGKEDLEFKAYKGGRDWAKSYTQQGNQQAFSQGVCKDKKTATTVSEVFIRVKPRNAVLSAGKFIGKMTFTKGGQSAVETFNIYSMETEIVVIKAEEVSFNTYNLELEVLAKEGTVPDRGKMVDCR